MSRCGGLGNVEDSDQVGHTQLSGHEKVHDSQSSGVRQRAKGSRSLFSHISRFGYGLRWHASLRARNDESLVLTLASACNNKMTISRSVR
jgi:hypothetical protein